MKVVSLENITKYNQLLNKKIVKSVNSIKPDSNGNVRLGTEKSTFNKVVYDTGYFSIGADATYNFDLTGTDLENVPKDNINIRLIAKVTTAHYGFNVGDIAQLTPSVDYTNSYGDLDVCAYIRGNTLYVYSGDAGALSISTSKVGHLQKANVQIKAVLTAFVPDDGSILLIAEDQTNTSKLIGLPDGTLTWGDKNIVRSVNNVTADENGNVDIGAEYSSTEESSDVSQVISVNTKTKYHNIILNTSNSSITFVNSSETLNENSSTVIKLELFIKQGTGTNTVTWPDNIKWENGIEPVLSLEKDNVDLISLISLDNGQNYYGFAKAVWIS